MKSRFSSLFQINQKDFVLRFYPSHASKVLWLKQYIPETRYTQEEQFFRAYLHTGDVVIDVGANIGFFTLLSSTLAGPTGKVYAFEPQQKVYKYLQGNIALNNITNVETFNIALGNENTTVCLSNNQKKDDHNFIVSHKFHSKRWYPICIYCCWRRTTISSATLATSALSTNDGDMVFVAGTCGNSGTYSVYNGFTEGIEINIASADAVAGYKAATGAAETPSVTHSNINRQAIVGLVVQAQ